MKTALQELINEYKADLIQCPSKITTKKYREFLSSVIKKLESKLPKEREQIEDAYQRGWNERHFEVHTDYYEETFESDETAEKK